MNTDLEKQAIERLKMFAPKDGSAYYLCYSGGKDSDCIRILAELSGVPYEIHHNLTTVDAPETIQYIKSIPGVIIEKARYADGTPKTMWNLMPKKLMLPTRLVRWCCTQLKEWGGKGRLRITGVRWAESLNRKKNQAMLTLRGKPKTMQRMLEEAGLNYQISSHGGILLGMDNETVRDAGDFVQSCFRTVTTTVNPIVDWSDTDVWEFLHHYGCDGNPLYKCGRGRIGCIGCPMAMRKKRIQDFRLYPKYYASYIRAFEKMLKQRREQCKPCRNWADGEAVMRWWLNDGNIDLDGQTTLFDENDLYEIMSDNE